MIGEQAILAAMGGLVAAQLLGLYGLYRVRRRATENVAPVADPGEYVDEDGVECPHCGARNELGYRFCARCVGELPGRMSFSRGSKTPFSRRTM